MRPHVIIRKKAVGNYIPLGRTQLEELIRQGLLKVVPLSPSGRAVGVTLESIIQYQRDVMGLGCVKMCARDERVELFSQLSCPDGVRQHFIFHIVEVERNFLSQISILEFSHSLGLQPLQADEVDARLRQPNKRKEIPAMTDSKAAMSESTDIESAMADAPPTLPGQITPGGFDYAALKSDVAVLAHRTAEKLRTYERRTVTTTIGMGKNLLRLKQALGHGKFTDWVATEFPGSQRTVERCILVAAKFADEIDTVSNLQLSTVYLLAARSTPKALRDKTLARSEKGELIDQHALRAEIKRAGLKPRPPRPIDPKKQQLVEQAEAAAQELLEEFGRPTIRRLLEAVDDRRVLAALRKAIGDRHD